MGKGAVAGGVIACLLSLIRGVGSGLVVKEGCRGKMSENGGGGGCGLMRGGIEQCSTQAIVDEHSAGDVCLASASCDVEEEFDG